MLQTVTFNSVLLLIVFISNYPVFVTSKIEVQTVRETRNTSKIRQEKLFGILTHITFPDVECTTELGLKGVCLSPENCGSKSGGKSRGQCAQGFGVCCVFIIKSNDTIKVLDQKVSYLRNQAFPQPDTTNLVQTITLEAKDEDTSQILVELLEFQLDSGSLPLTGCDRHSITVSGVDGDDVNVGELCGFNNGQHLYIHLRRTNAPVTVSFKLTENLQYIYNIRITQLDESRKEDRRRLAPTGCHQLFTEMVGNLVSFNFNPNSPTTSRYQQNIKYTICILPPSQGCQVNFSLGSISDMSIGSNPPSSNINLCGDASCRDSCNGNIDDKQMDFIEIAGSVISNDMEEERSVVQFCGNTGLGWSNKGFPGGLGVRSQRPGLKSLSFVTDGEKLVPDKEIGFNIQYDVDLCSSSII